MYRIHDFHSSLAPKIKSIKQFVYFMDDDSDDDLDDAGEAYTPDPAIYEQFFKVVVNDENIYLEDVQAMNEAGWTPLHTCCMSFLTVQAGIAIIEEINKLGGGLDDKTLIGPG